MCKNLIKERRNNCGKNEYREYFKYQRFNGTDDSDDEKQNQMLSLDALADE